MQIVLCNNRIIAHGENFLAMGGVVINTETGAKFENATVAECEGCPSDIDSVGYEYHAGEFVPCAPYGKGNNNGYFMEVCETCATPRSSGIPIKGGIKLENLDTKDITANNLGGTETTLLWENASPQSAFASQTITLNSDDYTLLMIEYQCGWGYSGDNDLMMSTIFKRGSKGKIIDIVEHSSGGLGYLKRYSRTFTSYSDKSTLFVSDAVQQIESEREKQVNNTNNSLVPVRIYGVKI